MEYTKYIKRDLLQLKVQYKASLVGSTSHPFIIHYLVLVAHSQFDSFVGQFIIWKAFFSYQVKKKSNQTKIKQNDINDPKCHFTRANKIVALLFVAPTDHILVLALHFVQVQIYCC